MIEFTRLFLVNNMFTILLLVMFAGFFAIISKKVRLVIISLFLILTASYGLLVVNKYTHAFVWFHDAVFASMKISFAIIGEINTLLYETRYLLRYMCFGFYISSRMLIMLILNHKYLDLVIDYVDYNFDCEFKYIDNVDTSYEFVSKGNVLDSFVVLRL